MVLSHVLICFYPVVKAQEEAHRALGWLKYVYDVKIIVPSTDMGQNRVGQRLSTVGTDSRKGGRNQSRQASPSHPSHQSLLSPNNAPFTDF